MNVKMRNEDRSLKTILLAIVVAIALAIGGIGAALAMPNLSETTDSTSDEIVATGVEESATSFGLTAPEFTAREDTPCNHEMTWETTGESANASIEEYNGSIIYHQGFDNKEIYHCTKCDYVMYEDAMYDTPDTSNAYVTWKLGDSEVAKFYPHKTGSNWITPDPINGNITNMTCTLTVPTFNGNETSHTFAAVNSLGTPIAKSEFASLGWLVGTDGKPVSWTDWYDQSQRADLPTSTSFTQVSPLMYLEYQDSDSPNVRCFEEMVSWVYAYKLNGEQHIGLNVNDDDIALMKSVGAEDINSNNTSYAALYEDTLIIGVGDIPETYEGKELTESVTDIENLSISDKHNIIYQTGGLSMVQRRSDEITTIRVVDKVSPINADNWFSWMYNLTSVDLSRFDMSKCESARLLFDHSDSIEEVTLGTEWSFESIDLEEQNVLFGEGTFWIRADSEDDPMTWKMIAESWDPSMAATYVPIEANQIILIDGFDGSEIDSKIVRAENATEEMIEKIKADALASMIHEGYELDGWIENTEDMTTTYTANWKKVGSDTPEIISHTFKLKFKATGIQATGFKDYKEAFAVLNGLTH